jgi:hypothetical protein
MSTKKKQALSPEEMEPQPLTDADMTIAKAMAEEVLSESEPLPPTLAVCTAKRGDRACTLATGHAGYHHSVPTPGVIDGVLSWK